MQAAWGANGLAPALLVASCALCFHLTQLDTSVVGAGLADFGIDLMESVLLGCSASALMMRLLPVLFPQTAMAFVAGVGVGLMPVLVRLILENLASHGKCTENVLIVGTGDLPARLLAALGCGAWQPQRRVRALTVAGTPGEWNGAMDAGALGELAAGGRVSKLVIAERDAQSRQQLADLLLDSRLRGLQVYDAVDFYEEVSGKLWVEGLTPQWFVYSNGFRRSQTGVFLKRCFDVACALLVIATAAPFLAVIALAIMLDSPGPVIFRQLRVGLHGKPFAIYKFRSMREDAERETGPAWATECDSRVTKVGRLLRLFRLDEIPQAFNVLKGDMSMVGPRPERPCFVEQLEGQIPFYNCRDYLKPGITGWAQVMCRYAASVSDSREKLQYDLYYAKHSSLRCDALILLKTVRTVLLGRGR
jgi:exopolysaccharide biosynthesis polyprenyl glycosylphosphotransferase